MASRNVLRVNEVEERDAFREAVRQIIVNIQKDCGETLIDIAERINVTAETISNAVNRKNSLSPTYLKRLGEAYGPHTLDPYLKLFGARGVPVQAHPDRDVLPFLNRAALKIAEARDPSSPGGGRELLREKLGYLTDLRAVVEEASALICEIEHERDAA